MPRLSALLSACLLLLCLQAPVLAAGDEAAAEESPTAQQIPFKQTSEVGGATYLRVGSVLLLMLVVAAGVILLLKKLVFDRRMLPFANARIRLLEAKRISGKVSVFLLDVDGTEYLLSQAGDSSHVLRHEGGAERQQQ